MSKIHKIFSGNPAQKDYVAKRNDNFIRKIRGLTSDGQPYDFTSHTFNLHVRKTQDSETITIDIEDSYFSLDQDDAGEEANVQNIVVINAPPQLFSEDITDYYYDIEMTDIDSNIQTIQEGFFTVTKDTTRVEEGV